MEDVKLLKALKLSRSTGAALAVVGVSWGCLAAQVPDLKAQTGLDQAGLGLALLFAAFGGLVSMFFAPKIMPKLGPNALPVLALCVALALFLPGHAHGYWSMGGSLFFMGMSIALLDICANMRIAETEAETDQPLMNLNHGLFSLFFAFSALGSGFLRSFNVAPPMIFFAASVVVVALAWIAREKGAPEGDALPAQQEPAEAPKTGLPWLAISLTALIFFSAFVGENAIESWTALYLETELGAEKGEGSLGPFAFGLIMAVGRFSGQVAVARFGPERLALVSGILGASGAALLALAPSQAFAIAAIGLAALGLSVLVPNANTILVKFARKGQRGLVLARAWMCGFIGFFVGPSMIGLIAEASNLRVAFGVVAAFILLIVPVVLLLSRMPKLR